MDFYEWPNGVSYIGSVYYGHLSGISAQALYNYNIITVGVTCPNAVYKGCYEGVHVHMEQKGAYSAITGPCWSAVTYGSTRIYTWKVLI
jgi:hypothetical protein